MLGVPYTILQSPEVSHRCRREALITMPGLKGLEHLHHWPRLAILEGARVHLGRFDPDIEHKKDENHDLYSF